MSVKAIVPKDLVMGYKSLGSKKASAAKDSFSFKNAVRLQESFTAVPERKLLLWLAARVPLNVNSDHLTLLGFISMSLAGASYALASWTPVALLLATVFLALNWLGDSLDGTLARVRHCQRPRATVSMLITPLIRLAHSF